MITAEDRRALIHALKARLKGTPVSIPPDGEMEDILDRTIHAWRGRDVIQTSLADSMAGEAWRDSLVPLVHAEIERRGSASTMSGWEHPQSMSNRELDVLTCGLCPESTEEWVTWIANIVLREMPEHMPDHADRHERARRRGRETAALTHRLDPWDVEGAKAHGIPVYDTRMTKEEYGVLVQKLADRHGHWSHWSR